MKSLEKQSESRPQPTKLKKSSTYHEFLCRAFPDADSIILDQLKNCITKHVMACVEEYLILRRHYNFKEFPDGKKSFPDGAIIREHDLSSSSEELLWKIGEKETTCYDGGCGGEWIDNCYIVLYFLRTEEEKALLEECGHNISAGDICFLKSQKWLSRTYLYHPFGLEKTLGFDFRIE